MKAQIIAIGDELLIGQTLDTNSNFLSSELTQLGFIVEKITIISDQKDSIIEALLASDSVNLRIITGGLGPTKDDKTKEILADSFKMPLEFNPEVYKDVCAFVDSINAPMNALNKNQALFPKGAEILQNKQGTAPGIWFNTNNNITISLPGVPFEMKSIFKNEVLPRIKAFFELQQLYYQTVMVAGYGESALAIQLEDWENQLPPNMTLAYLPSPEIIKLRLGSRGKDLDVLHFETSEQIKKLKQIIGNNIFSIHESTLELTVSKLLINNNKTISTAESCTGGTLAQLLTSVAGSSAYFKGSIVAYDNSIKENILEVAVHDIETYGAVSAQVVEQMAKGVKKIMSTDYAIATSGIAGPGGGTTEKPVGTVWIAISGPQRTISKEFRFGNRRDINILRSAMAALNFLRLELINT